MYLCLPPDSNKERPWFRKEETNSFWEKRREVKKAGENPKRKEEEASKEEENGKCTKAG